MDTSQTCWRKAEYLLRDDFGRASLSELASAFALGRASADPSADTAGCRGIRLRPGWLVQVGLMGQFRSTISCQVTRSSVRSMPGGTEVSDEAASSAAIARPNSTSEAAKMEDRRRVAVEPPHQEPRSRRRPCAKCEWYPGGLSPRYRASAMAGQSGGEKPHCRSPPSARAGRIHAGLAPNSRTDRGTATSTQCSATRNGMVPRVVAVRGKYVPAQGVHPGAETSGGRLENVWPDGVIEGEIALAAGSG